LKDKGRGKKWKKPPHPPHTRFMKGEAVLERRGWVVVVLWDNASEKRKERKEKERAEVQYFYKNCHSYEGKKRKWKKSRKRINEHK